MPAAQVLCCLLLTTQTLPAQFVRARLERLGVLVDSDFLETLLDVLREHFGGCFSRLMARVCTAWRDAVSRRRALWEYAGLRLDPRT